MSLPSTPASSGNQTQIMCAVATTTQTCALTPSLGPNRLLACLHPTAGKHRFRICPHLSKWERPLPITHPHTWTLDLPLVFPSTLQHFLSVPAPPGCVPFSLPPFQGDPCMANTAPPTKGSFSLKVKAQVPALNHRALPGPRLCGPPGLCHA